MANVRFCYPEKYPEFHGSYCSVLHDWTWELLPLVPLCAGNHRGSHLVRGKSPRGKKVLQWVFSGTQRAFPWGRPPSRGLSYCLVQSARFLVCLCMSQFMPALLPGLCVYVEAITGHETSFSIPCVYLINLRQDLSLNRKFLLVNGLLGSLRACLPVLGL